MYTGLAQVISDHMKFRSNLLQVQGVDDIAENRVGREDNTIETAYNSFLLSCATDLGNVSMQSD